MMLQGYKDKDTTHVYLVMQWPHECKGGLVLLLIQSSNSRFMFGVRDKHREQAHTHNCKTQTNTNISVVDP